MNKYYEPYKLSILQRAFLVPYYSIGSILDPNKGDRIAGLGDVTSPVASKFMKKVFLSNIEGRKLLKDKPLITNKELNIYKLRTLPDNTLGRVYMNYMDSHAFSADERPTVKYHDDPELAYLMARYRQVHDFWHALSGLKPSIIGEITLKCFEFQVTGLPVCLLSTTFGQLRLSPKESMRLWTIGIPWAIRAGRKCNSVLEAKDAETRSHVLTYYYEENVEKSVDEVRDLLNFEKAPEM